MLARLRPQPVPAGIVFGFGLGGLVDGIVLHQILQWHHLVSATTPASTVDGLEHNTRADGLFHAATVAVLVFGAVLLWSAAKRATPGWDGLVVGGVLVGAGAFHVVDEVVFHALLELHHIRMVEDYLAYDLGFAAVGVVLLAVGLRVLRRRPAR